MFNNTLRKEKPKESPIAISITSDRSMVVFSRYSATNAKYAPQYYSLQHSVSGQEQPDFFWYLNDFLFYVQMGGTQSTPGPMAHFLVKGLQVGGKELGLE